MDIRASKEVEARVLMELQAEALYTYDRRGRMLRVNEPNGGVAPRMFLGRTIQGTTVCRFRHDVPDDLVRQLEALCAEEGGSGDPLSNPRHYEAYMALLDGQVSTMGPAYRIPVLIAAAASAEAAPVVITRQNAKLLAGGFDWLAAEVDHAQPCLAILSGGRAVSVCRSVRITARVHEAGLETLPSYRGRGYAAAVVTGWAAAVRQAGRIPLYSTSWENLSSRRVAQKLALDYYGTDFAIV
ncbi:GNAT family N-acetyltransferase [Paenibacillus sp. GCM10023250]|uniref:GNAT family N-acetyltransferase n=1 Tax=Paenibacillus sp. GCM10023250 TaxID=3252648 RepID=UPI00361654A6